MKIHRYYVPEYQLLDTVEITNKDILHQWLRVLRYQPGRSVRLFNDQHLESEYSLISISKDLATLELIDTVKAKVAKREIYLCFSLLKKDKNEWVLQKATELGVSCFVPLISARTEKTGWNQERAEKIVIEASEQCGRTDVPVIASPTKLEMVKESLPDGVHIYVAEQSNINYQISNIQNPVGILIGPEGGWSDEEKALFIERGLEYVSLGQFTLRAETAAITAVVRLT